RPERLALVRPQIDGGLPTPLDFGLRDPRKLLHHFGVARRPDRCHLELHSGEDTDHQHADGNDDLEKREPSVSSHWMSTLPAGVTVTVLLVLESEMVRRTSEAIPPTQLRICPLGSHTTPVATAGSEAIVALGYSDASCSFKVVVP